MSVSIDEPPDEINGWTLDKDRPKERRDITPRRGGEFRYTAILPLDPDHGAEGIKIGLEAVPNRRTRPYTYDLELSTDNLRVHRMWKLQRWGEGNQDTQSEDENRFSAKATIASELQPRSKAIEAAVEWLGEHAPTDLDDMTLTRTRYLVHTGDVGHADEAVTAPITVGELRDSWQQFGGGPLQDDFEPTGLAAFEGDAYDPTTDLDNAKPEPKIMGFGDYRRRAVERLDATPRLDPIESFSSIDEMVEAVEEIHIPGYSKPPERILKGLRNAYEELPSDEARRYYLNDYKLGRTINAARRAFNDWVGRKKRYDQIPGWAEAGPSNYPVRKHRKASDSERRGKEEFDEKIERLRGRVNGARSRALKKAGTSVAEQNEMQREAQRAEGRETYEKGDIVFHKPYVSDWNPWGVKRVNKKSLTLSRPHPSPGVTPSYASKPNPDFDTVNWQFDRPTMTKGPLTPEQVEQAESLPDDYQEAQIELFGEAWVKRNLPDNPDIADEQIDELPDTDDTDIMSDDTLIDELKGHDDEAYEAEREARLKEQKKRESNARYWAAQALWWMKNGPNAGIDGRYYVEIIGGKPVIVLDDSWNEDTVNAVKDGLRDYGFPLPFNERELDDEWRLFVSKPTDERLVSGDADWREFESQTDFEDTENPEQAADEAQQWTDDREDRRGGQSLELFGMEVQQRVDSASREHRAAQNKGYLATPIEPTSVENEREGLGRFGVRTADTIGLEQFERKDDGDGYDWPDAADTPKEAERKRHAQMWGESEIRGKKLTNEQVGRIRHHAGNNDLLYVMVSAQVDTPGNVMETLGDVDGLIAYYEENDGFSDLEGVGPSFDARLTEIMPLVREGRGDDPAPDGWDAESIAKDALDAANAKAEARDILDDEQIWGPIYDGLPEADWAVGKWKGASVSDLDVSNFIDDDDRTRPEEEEDTAAAFAAFAEMDQTDSDTDDVDEDSYRAVIDLDDERDAQQAADEAQARDEDDGSRKRLTHEFDSRDTANAVRDKLPEGAETDKYDRRHKTVQVYADALDDSDRDMWETEVLDSQREEGVKYGQADLTDDEKRRLKKRDGWTWGTHGFHARSAKAILTAHGVDDWLAKYDHTIEARDHLSVVPSKQYASEQFTEGDGLGTGAQSGGASNYTDADEDDAPHIVARRAKSANKAQGEECHHAEEWCGKGDEAACIHLVSDCGWTDEEIEEMRADVAEMEVRMDSLVTDDGGPIKEGEEAVTPEVVEAAGGDGTELPPFALRTLQRAWNGFRAAALEAEEGKKAIENYNESLREAREYGAMVNEVRARFGQEPMEIRTTVTVKTEDGKKEQRTVALDNLPRLVNVEWGDAGTNAPTAETEGTTLFGRLGGLFEFDAPTYDPMIDMATDGGVAVAANATATSLMDTDYQKALEHHRRRSPKAQDMDESIQAREQVGDFETWIQAPNQMDFVGVDSLKFGGMSP